MNMQSPKGNLEGFDQPFSQTMTRPPGRSILYGVDTNPTDYFHKNNVTTPTVSQNKRISLDDISQKSKHRARLQKSFLDDSKVNKAVARDLMNSRPIYTVQQIQGGQVPG